jgi:glucose uptake protein GlcU
LISTGNHQFLYFSCHITFFLLYSTRPEASSYHLTKQFGFQKGKAVVVTTLAQVAGLVGGILGGIIIFNEWGGLVPEIVGLKIGAVAAILVGVMILSRRTGQLKACGASSNPI